MQTKEAKKILLNVLNKMENKDIKISGKIASKDEIIEKVKLKQKQENTQKQKFFNMNKQIEVENQIKIAEETKKKTWRKDVA